MKKTIEVNFKVSAGDSRSQTLLTVFLLLYGETLSREERTVLESFLPQDYINEQSAIPRLQALNTILVQLEKKLADTL
jgi:hypothetical protein